MILACQFNHSKQSQNVTFVGPLIIEIIGLNLTREMLISSPFRWSVVVAERQRSLTNWGFRFWSYCTHAYRLSNDFWAYAQRETEKLPISPLSVSVQETQLNNLTLSSHSGCWECYENEIIIKRAHERVQKCNIKSLPLAKLDSEINACFY